MVHEMLSLISFHKQISGTGEGSHFLHMMEKIVEQGLWMRLPKIPPEIRSHDMKWSISYGPYDMGRIGPVLDFYTKWTENGINLCIWRKAWWRPWYHPFVHYRSQYWSRNCTRKWKKVWIYTNRVGVQQPNAWRNRSLFVHFPITFRSAHREKFLTQPERRDKQSELFKAIKKVNHFENLRNLFQTDLGDNMVL